MAEKKKILVLWELTAGQRALIEDSYPEAEFQYVSEKEVTAGTVKGVHAILGNLAPSLLPYADSLEWLQLNSAGANGYCGPGVLPEKAVLTNASGAYGLAIAEHMLGMILALQKNLLLYYDNQQNGVWRDEGPVTGIYHSRTLVLGTGNLGQEFARRMKALGSTVTGLCRSQKEKPDCLDEQYTMDCLDRKLPRADIVALCLPGTDQTRHILDERRIGLMKKTALLVNVGRGNLVDQEALVRALRECRLAGAALDVTEPEPLPREDPLWSAPNLLLTPHVSGGYHMKETFEYILEITAKNLRAYRQGQPFERRVNLELGY